MEVVSKLLGHASVTTTTEVYDLDHRTPSASSSILPSSSRRPLRCTPRGRAGSGAGRAAVPQTADLSRLVHHAVEAGDDGAVVRHGPTAAREASLAGAHRQAVAVYEQVLTRRRLLPTAQCAALLDAYAWSLHNMHSTQQAVAAATDAVRL